MNIKKQFEENINITISNGLPENSVPPNYQWPFQDPRLEVLTIYKAYFSGLCKGISPQNMARNMVRLRTSIFGSWNSH